MVIIDIIVRIAKTIHYENPKPTATLICPKGDSILLGRRAFRPGKGEWGLPGGFMELNETLEEAAIRELKEETNLNGKFKNIRDLFSLWKYIWRCTLIGVVVNLEEDLSLMCAGDDVSELNFFGIDKLPSLAFDCHRKIVQYYLNELKIKSFYLALLVICNISSHFFIFINYNLVIY